ncbi:YxeA family protein [Enterococcus faecalis]|nr:YxeA family protein [Enterococcus faecalis]NAA62277.1 YxeA family protein [Enterococcus faecalis]NAB66118.1 YxeA family protein [Enterococcus faecalis]NAB86299.1 YxeA family protein [Enterococcus faecalis]NAB89234.1 YxeA family protein [Enterococcus faecalis]
MKKFMLSLGFFGLLYGGITYMVYPQTYYVKVTQNGELGNSRIGYKSYYYKLKGYDSNGNEKKIDFSIHPYLNRPIKKNAYLKIIYNNLKQVTTYKEVKKKEVPQKVLNKIKTNYKSANN